MTVVQSEVHTQKKNQAPRLVAGVRKRVILRRPALKPYRIFLSTYQIRCALRALNEAALLATIWNLRRATKIHGDIFVSNAKSATKSGIHPESSVLVLSLIHI